MVRIEDKLSEENISAPLKEKSLHCRWYARKLRYHEDSKRRVRFRALYLVCLHPQITTTGSVG